MDKLDQWEAQGNPQAIAWHLRQGKVNAGLTAEALAKFIEAQATRIAALIKVAKRAQMLGISHDCGGCALCQLRDAVRALEEVE